MAIGDDFEVQADGDIRHVAGTARYTVIEFHRWLGDLMDDAAASGNDLLDITDSTASERSTDNIITLKPPYNIDDDAAQYLYDGSIIQKNGDEIYDGLVVIANQGMPLEIIQNGAKVTPNFWGTGINADAAAGYSHRFMLKVRTAGADIDGRRIIGQTRSFGFTYSEFRIGTGTQRGNNVLALTYAQDLNNQTAAGTVAGWNSITNTEGFRAIDVDGNGTPENYYSEWNKDTFTINQFYERMKWLTRAGSGSTIYGLNGELFRGITHEINLTTPRSGTFNAVESVSWTGGTGKMLAINSAATGTKMWIQLLTGVAPTNGQTITGGSSSATTTASGTATERDVPAKASLPFCGQSTGSSIVGAYGFGIETTDLSASDRLFDLTNTQRTPPNNVTFTVNGLVSGEDRVLVTPLGYTFAYDGETGGPFQVGETLTFTSPAGTAVLVNLVDNGSTGYMTVRMSTGSVPTDNSTISGGTSGASASVNGSVSPDIDVRQFTLNGALTGATVTSVVVNQAIPTDTPTTGTIRILRASGVYTRHSYTAWTGSTFTIPSTDFSSDNAANGANSYISYIDKLATGTSESFTGVYTGSDRSLFVRVRDGGGTPIKTFETTGTLGSAGGSSTAIRTSDT